MIIKLHVHHNLLKQSFIEIRFDTMMKIQEVKDKIYQMTGTAPQNQDVTLVRSPTSSVTLSPEHATLGDFGAQTDMDLNVVDRNPYSVLSSLNQSNVEDYYVKMSDEQYDKMEGTVRAFKKEKFRTDPVYRKTIIEARQKRDTARQEEMAAAALITVGCRCKLLSREKCATVRYLGALENQVGIYVGIELDLPFGNCAGENEGQVYFICQKNCGIFVKPQEIEVGDFPEEDLDLDDDEL
ncbi:Tubulin_specific chaperone B [Hexamita inflata]|uniref:Tubulin specific chaperone B n=1 Tax=Hexamita inflata TaxID=28002 RepID=A0AA86N5S2_9EUKA|nr:Tubulin specific chaperone B [Hexamita inflata]CAI9924625.1 Tubulin specific chaperone B [Hexamita inflata]CAI9967268.1 Tubulin specific chaperone B [Hexamita inflata]